MAKAYNIMQNILIVVVLILFFAIAGTKVLFDISTHFVISGSMEPEIMTGSLCFINERDKNIKKDDIIAFKKGETLITHRVVNIKDGVYITKGDNNDVMDLSPVLPEEVVGKTVFWIPKLGYWIAAIQTKRGIIIGIMAVVAFILLGQILPRKEACNEKAKKQE